MNDQSPQSPSVWSRRFKYGLNVAVFVLAALAIVIFVNWIAVRQAGRWGRWTRFDLTATRQYSLSPQTRQVLGHLDQDVSITTLFLTGSASDPQTAEKIRYFSDLLDEYQRWGQGRVKVSHIHPALEVEKFRVLCTQIADSYKDQLTSAQNGLAAAKQTLQQISDFGKTQSTLLTHRLPDLQSKADPQLAKLLQQITLTLSSLDKQLQIPDLAAAIDKISTADLPDMTGIKSQVSEPVRQLRDNFLIPAVKAFDQRINSGDTHPDVKAFLIETRDTFNQITNPISKTIDALDSINTNGYDTVRSSIMQANSSIVMTPDRITVIKLDDVYTDVVNADPDQPQQQAPAPGQRFRGEESVTGAIISLTLKTKSMVVFVNSSPQPVTRPGGAYSFVASQLTNMNFIVTEWNPAGRASPYAPPTPEPKPTPEPGQPIVWVFLPQAPPNPQMPFMPPSSQVSQTLKQAIKDHQPCFVILAPNAMARFGQADEVADTLKDMGIEVDSSTLVLNELISSDGRPVSTAQVSLTTWPKAHPIDQALAGQIGVLVSSMPLTLTPQPDTQVWPLIQTPADTWAETDLNSSRPKQDAGEKRGPFTVAAAFSSKNERLVVLADPNFATDRVTQYGQMDPFTGRLLYAVYPANSELFTNSIYWLAGHDELIATGARSQDIRRYGDISTASHIAVWWIVLAGLPVFCLVAGGIVWLVRRK